jgi:hypothetical protein
MPWGLADRVGTGQDTLIGDGEEIDTIDQRLCHLTVDGDPGDRHHQLDNPLLDAGLIFDLEVFRLELTGEPADVSKPQQNLMADFEGLDGDKALERQIGVLGCHALRGLPGCVVRPAGQAGKPAGLGRRLGCGRRLDQNQAQRCGNGARTESVTQNPGGRSAPGSPLDQSADRFAGEGQYQ